MISLFLERLTLVPYLIPDLRLVQIITQTQVMLVSNFLRIYILKIYELRLRPPNMNINVVTITYASAPRVSSSYAGRRASIRGSSHPYPGLESRKSGRHT